MPTGYTEIIDDNQDVTFEDFVWRCARAFGACVTMREDPLDKAIPEFKVDTYYEQSVHDAEVNLAKTKGLTLEQAGEKMREEFESIRAWRETARQRNESIRERYRDVRLKVQCWSPPTTEHENLKKFMLEQLDTGEPYPRYWQERPAPTDTAEQWLTKRITLDEMALSNALKSLAEERERIASRNAWVRTLAESVPVPETLKP